MAQCIKFCGKSFFDEIHDIICFAFIIALVTVAGNKHMPCNVVGQSNVLYC